MTQEFINGMFAGLYASLLVALIVLFAYLRRALNGLVEAADSYAKSAKACADYVCGKLDEEISGMKGRGPNAKKAHGGWKRQKRHANGRFGGKK